MDELVLRFRAIFDKLNALKDALSDEQLKIYNDSLNKAKQKAIETFSNNESTLLELIEEVYR
jgi:hypothetical protein